MTRILFDLVVGEFQQMAKAKDDRRDRFEVNLLYHILIEENLAQCWNCHLMKNTQSNQDSLQHVTDLHRQDLQQNCLTIS